jgi:hypothetical protein
MFIIKKDDAKHEIAGIVYMVGEIDRQGDKIEDVKVLKTAERGFMQRYDWGEDVFNIDHDDNRNLEDIEILESTIFESPTRKFDQIVPGGSWYMRLRIPDELYPLVKDAVGFSMQGSGEGRKI